MSQAAQERDLGYLDLSYFRKLPAEIRLLIWSFWATTERLVRVRVRTRGLLMQVAQPVPFPDREAKEEFYRHNPDSLELQCHSIAAPDPLAGCAKVATAAANFKRDIFYFHTAENLRGGRFGTGLWCCDYMDRNPVKRIMIDLAFFQGNFEHIHRGWSCEELFLVARPPRSRVVDDSMPGRGREGALPRVEDFVEHSHDRITGTKRRRGCCCALVRLDKTRLDRREVFGPRGGWRLSLHRSVPADADAETFYSGKFPLFRLVRRRIGEESEERRAVAPISTSFTGSA